MKIKKKKTLIVVVAILFLIIAIPTTIFIVNHFSKSLVLHSHMEIYHKYAEEFVREETDAIEKFGENSRIITDECIYTFNETSSERDIVDSVEEFEARIEHIQIKVEVGLRNYCIVIFEKNSANELEIVNWYWEK